MADVPGWPGIEARWTSSAKTRVGSSLSPVSRVWFTVSHGIVNEVSYPRVDQACTRDFGLLVTDGAKFFAEEKRDCSFETTTLEDGVPAFQVVSTHLGGRFASPSASLPIRGMRWRCSRSSSRCWRARSCGCSPCWRRIW